MRDPIDVLKNRIAPAQATQAQLEELLDSSTALYLNKRYPYTDPPVDGDGDPVIGPIGVDWIIRAAVEMFLRAGLEGQISGGQLGNNRSFDSGTVSTALLREIVPVSGVWG